MRKTVTFHGRISAVGFDKEHDAEGNVVKDGTTAMNYMTIKFSPPEDEFSDMGAPDDPLNLKAPHSIVYIHNMTVPDLERALLYGRAKLTLDFEVDETLNGS